jgi:hypothetical protein
VLGDLVDVSSYALCVRSVLLDSWVLLLAFAFDLHFVECGLGLGLERECVDRNACR